MQSYRKLVKALKAKYGPFRIRRVTVSKRAFADCKKTKDGFLIRISKELDEPAAMEMCIHEVSHMLTWDEHLKGRTHGKKWAIAYSEVYSIYERVCDESHLP